MRFSNNVLKAGLITFSLAAAVLASGEWNLTDAAVESSGSSLSSPACRANNQYPSRQNAVGSSVSAPNETGDVRPNHPDPQDEQSEQDDEAKTVSPAQWSYRTTKPAGQWTKADYDESDWASGRGGFGTRHTPGARVGTEWRTDHIWLRRTFEFNDVPAKPGLLMHHDDAVEVYINGQLAIERDGWTTDYELFELPRSRVDLKKGTNTLAVHCRQFRGGQFIDVHVVDAENPPSVPPPARPTRPFVTELSTPWGEAVTAENAWTEYPRPGLVRSNWQNLNGHWDYAITKSTQQQPPEEWNGKLLVPFCVESALSGAQKLLHPDQALWYHRQFQLEKPADKRILLHFEAVDYRCQVWVNQQRVGQHVGGSHPFSFDITSALKRGVNRLLVRVEDDTQSPQLTGKQTLRPHGIWYTRVSGIWQTVWLEPVNPRHIQDLHISTDAQRGEIQLSAELAGRKVDGEQLAITVRDGKTRVATQTGPADQTFKLVIDDAKRWSPATPHLYDLAIELRNRRGEVIDRVESYAGIRDVGKSRDPQGHLQFTLNGEPIFHWGTLDQGWWPDGLLTPPSDEAMRSDIEFLKSAGFNMIRKHIKVEPRRYYYHCDRLGMLVWQDQVSGGPNPNWTRLQPDPQDAQWPEDAHAQFMEELEAMVDTLENHPSIVVWVPFNESWGQHRTMEIGEWLANRDSSRLIDIASGGNFWPIGDIVDAHNYPEPKFPFDPSRFNDFIRVIGEFGGHGFPVEGHLWDADRGNWGYGDLPESQAEYRQRYIDSIRRLAALRDQGIAAGVYTQTSDVEIEVNGLLTYDRRVKKLTPQELREIHKILQE